MNRALAALTTAALTAALVACSSNDRDDPPAASGDGASGGQCDPELADAFAAWGEAGFSGSLAVLGDGEADCLAAYGLADQATERANTPDTVYAIGSVTKAFTAAAILDLVDQDALALGARAGDLVEGLSGPAADVTVEQLLLHTSGLTGSHGQDHVPMERDTAVAALGQLELAFEPGSEFLYSNAGYTLLALVVEGASGTGYRDYVTSRLLSLPDGDVAGGFWRGEPAAPDPRAVGYLEDGSVGDTGDDPAVGRAPWGMEGNGGLALSMPELARWSDALFGGDLLSAGATEILTTLTFDQGDGAAEVPGWVAFDPSLLGEPAYTTAGGGGTGHNAVVAVLPESGRVVALASNTADLTAEELLDAVGPALVAGDPLPRPEGSGRTVPPAELEAVAGPYELDGGGTFEVGSDDDALTVSADGAAAVAALFPLDDWTADDVAAHEAAVEALLAGETAEGREELEALESDLGPVDDVALAGTIVRDGELRTYVTLTSGAEMVLCWYALDDAGGVAAVELDTQPPDLALVPAGDGSFQPDDPTGSGGDLTVTFADDTMSLTSPAGTTTARRVG